MKSLKTVILFLLSFTILISSGRTNSLDVSPYSATPKENKQNIYRIAFSSSKDGKSYDIYLVDLSNHEIVKLTNEGKNYNPVSSPDGKYIAFESERDSANQRQIYIMNSDGTNHVRVTTLGTDNHFAAWSPDSKQISFTSNLNNNSSPQIHIVQTSNPNPIKLSRTTSTDGYSAWSKDGKKIAFVSHLGESKHEITLMPTDNSSFVTLTDFGYIADFLACSPDGGQIAFVSNTENFTKYQIYIIDLASQDATMLTDKGNNYSPEWSSNGKYIAFSSTRDGDSQIYTMQANGDKQTKLTSKGYNRLPKWSGDNQYIAFISDRDGKWQIYIMEADGSNQIKITQDTTDNENFTWLPE
jgi:TolB protein